MQPGRALDALVAEKVMGITIPRWLIPLSENLDTITSRAVVPDYSTDIAAAWTVVEHTSLFATCGITEFRDEDGPGWCVESLADGWEVYAPTAPYAICLAALRAVGVDLPAEKP